MIQMVKKERKTMDHFLTITRLNLVQDHPKEKMKKIGSEL